MNGTAWTATRWGELAFCPQCLAEDPRRGVPMFWRRGWLDAFAASWPVHERPLRSVATAALALTRACEEAAGLLLGKEAFAEGLARAHLARRAGALHAAAAAITEDLPQQLARHEAHLFYALQSLDLVPGGDDAVPWFEKRLRKVLHNVAPSNIGRLDPIPGTADLLGISFALCPTPSQLVFCAASTYGSWLRSTRPTTPRGSRRPRHEASPRTVRSVGRCGRVAMIGVEPAQPARSLSSTAIWCAS
jgi:hypothetical protein